MRSPTIKRGIDVLGSAAALIIAAPLCATIALAIRQSMGSPVLFRQTRPGRDGELFTLIKFRTMRDGVGPDADRLTRLGRFLRSTSLDELPELWNVLRGDMSLVGPRPLLRSYLDRYTPAQARRHEMRPGLTGLAQVNGRNDMTWDERLRLDVHYVDTWTVAGDLSIIARTVPHVLRRDGITAKNHPTMPDYLGPEQNP